MINITRIKPTQNKFLSFFMEAEDDEEEKPARKMKVINVKPDNRSKKFDNIINRAKENEENESNDEDEMELVDDMEEDDMPDTDDPMNDDSSDESSDNDSGDDNKNTDSETNDTSDNTETNQDESENASDEEQDNSGNEDEGPNTDDPMDDSDEIDELSDSIDEDIKKEQNNSESTDDSGDDSDNSDGPDTSDPMADGDDGSSDDSDTGDGSDGSDNSEDASNASGENNGAGIDYDSMRKYNLFKNFISLYYGIDKYLDRIEAMIKDDPESNTVINDCIKRLHELKQLTYDYIIIKYNPAPYVQSMLFYQRLIASIEIIFKLVSSLNVKEEKPKRVKDNKKV